MSRPAARVAIALLPLVLLGCAGARESVAASPPAIAALIPDDIAILHVLQRVTYGPRPDDIARVRALGVSAWLERVKGQPNYVPMSA